MRAWTIFFYMLMLAASITFVNEMHIFNEQYIASPQEPYITYDISSLNETVGDIGTEQPIDMLVFAAKMAWEGLVMFMRIVVSAVLLFPLLVNLFNIPAPLAALIQVAWVATLIWGIIQFKSGRSGRSIE